MNKLTDFRNRIDTIDGRLIDILRKRFDIVEDVGDYKRLTMGTAFSYIDPIREYDLLEKQIAIAASIYMEPQMIKNLYRNLISFANFHEDQNLKIHIPSDISLDGIRIISLYYPIPMCYISSNFAFNNVSNSDIFCIEYRNLNAYIDFLRDNMLYIYHIEENSEKKDRSIIFCCKISKLYDKHNGIFIFANHEKQITKCDFSEYKINLEDDCFTLLGSSAPCIF
ncbi:chorismate mutase [Candidatus Deianiraea vastatrix]|uniref:chorismate mutase n=1 Tax=Candidatus Deianiraea vastatrix TaxID=2163644 RepID=A0A5B8XH91_9RICK|nr:chorismate mutase [Candidatus Deianiraea vastatrix]QED23481.1 Chorismate mutase [Candidatus Deianiraea vastatrix]